MSYTELHTGTAIELAKEVKGLHNKLVYLNIDTTEMDDDELLDGYVDSDIPYTYIKKSDKLFYLQNYKKVEPGDYLLEGSKNEVGDIGFTIMFYNGGTCFEEMFEDLVNKLDKD